MNRIDARLTIFFEDPFWVGVYEREEDGRLSACRIVFGAEPKDGEVYACLCAQWRSLRLSPPISGRSAAPRPCSPKRRQRMARQALESAGVGTKAQQALKLQQETGKAARAARSRAQREAEAAQRFALRQEKRREKHRGH